jgi:hypothetical protein
MAESINWGSVADWVAAAASFIASVTALYLASAAGKIKLRGSFGLRVIISHITPRPELVMVQVTNTGTRSTIVKMLGIRVGIWKWRRFAVIPNWDSQYSSPLPKALDDGEDASWGIELNAPAGGTNWLEDLCGDGFVKSWLDVETFRLQVHTSNGGTHSIQPEKALRQRMHAARQRARPATAPA